MSLAALLRATQDHLATVLTLTVDRDISVQEDDQPPPFVGQLHYVVHATDWRWPGATDNDVLDEQYGITVSITQRTPVAPRDRKMSHLYLDRLEGVEKLARQVMLACHLNYTLFGLANKYAEGTLALVEPLRWEATDPKPKNVGPDWFWATDPNATDCGWVLGVHFGRARRIQRIFKAGTQDDLE